MSTVLSLIRGVVETIQALDSHAFDELAMARSDVADIELSANPAASSELTDPVHGKRRCVGQVGPARLHKSDEGHHRVGDDLLHSLGSGFRIEMPKGDASVPPDGWQHGQEGSVPVRGILAA